MSLMTCENMSSGHFYIEVWYDINPPVEADASHRLDFSALTLTLILILIRILGSYRWIRCAVLMMCRRAALEGENTSLRVRLTETAGEKERDLALFREVVHQTKQLFLDALQQLKAKQQQKQQH